MPKTHADACPGPRFCILIAWVLPATSPDACADLPVGARRAAGRAAPSALVLAVGAAPRHRFSCASPSERSQACSRCVELLPGVCSPRLTSSPLPRWSLPLRWSTLVLPPTPLYHLLVATRHTLCHWPQIQGGEWIHEGAHPAPRPMRVRIRALLRVLQCPHCSAHFAHAGRDTVSVGDNLRAYHVHLWWDPLTIKSQHHFSHFIAFLI
jgi:hypothetical protein